MCQIRTWDKPRRNNLPPRSEVLKYLPISIQSLPLPPLFTSSAETCLRMSPPLSASLHRGPLPSHVPAVFASASGYRASCLKPRDPAPLSASLNLRRHLRAWSCSPPLFLSRSWSLLPLKLRHRCTTRYMSLVPSLYFESNLSNLEARSELIVVYSVFIGSPHCSMFRKVNCCEETSNFTQ